MRKNVLILFLISPFFVLLFFKIKSDRTVDDCLVIKEPVFSRSQISDVYNIEDYPVTREVKICNDDEYTIDYADIAALKYDVKRFVIGINSDGSVPIEVIKEEEWTDGNPTDNFIRAKSQLVSKDGKYCFVATSPILMDVEVEYCFYELSQNLFDLKIETSSTFPI